MDDLDFFKLSNQISDLTDEQRDQLKELLYSRLWLYQTKESRVECLYKLTDKEIETLLGKVKDDRLAYALLDTSPLLREKCRTALGENRYANIKEIQKEITPARFSEVCRAREDILREYSELVYQQKVEALCLLDERIDTLDEMEHHGDIATAALIAKIILYLDDSSLQRFLQKSSNYPTLARLALYSHCALALRKILINVSEHAGWIILSDMFEGPCVVTQSDINNALITFFEWLNTSSLYGQIAFPIELQEKLIYPWMEKNCPERVVLK